MKLEIKRIEYSECKIWLLKKHYAHRIPSISFAYGLFIDNLLEGIVCYGSPASQSLCKGVCGEKYRKDVLELNRLVLNSTAPKNSASMLVSRTLKMLPRDSIIVSYADTMMGHLGIIYQATNFLYTGATKPRTDIDSGEGKHSRHYEKGGDYSKRKFRSSKHRYIFFRNKKAKRDLKYPILPYPKGISDRYDCEDIKIANLFQ